MDHDTQKSVEGHGAEASSDVLADIEARSRAVERAEQALRDRERELQESSAAMARELRATAEAIRMREQELASAGVMPEVIATRRERLGRIRRVLRDRASKLQRYEAVLDDRAREADQILAQRREVSRAAAAVKERERRLAAVQARNKTMSASFFAAAAIAIVGVLSFAVADHVAPATYAATAEIVVDGRGRDLSADEIDEWQRYIAGLVMDPGLLELTADRMRKRGLLTLARASDLRVRLERDLTTDTPEAGRLKLELIGEGSAPTRRALDTYAITLVAQSNATKQQRAGGTGSRIEMDASIVDEPLEDARMTYAAGFGGGAMIGGLLIGSLVYRRLKSQHSRFEQGVID